MSKLSVIVQEQQTKFSVIDKNISDLRNHESELRSNSSAKLVGTAKYSLDTFKDKNSVNNDLNDLNKLIQEAEKERENLVKYQSKKLMSEIENIVRNEQRTLEENLQIKYLEDLQAAAKEIVRIRQEWLTELRSGLNDLYEERLNLRIYVDNSKDYLLTTSISSLQNLRIQNSIDDILNRAEN
ncbi:MULTISPECIES: hypothetical protein [unclassified Enterococcus]|uniref:hypothetical protein n=1 Tax=unclassified Enterococcus TaxID=2608891 RepID=UPI001551AC66|nr:MULTISPECIES: hypothetical protein [unclassified Enterococcus]MBS7576842.1 hypothetical protein [Enterococcus sp. MMGLQ5-2]MBS7584249.1 hypothetical protein [Enterococcus sp. MMGLQ5-1]NPD12105.1 hypothetical protein [Enterococcus sp. MMGLQ5-1]NPD36677.1 hypothetical protein [Enterococcus sp. MMGLQ5-2]